MRYIVPGAGTSFRIAILVADLDTRGVRVNHPERDHMLLVEPEKDVPDLLKQLTQTSSEYLVVTDAALWKKLVRKRKTTGYHGQVLPCQIPDFDYFRVIYAPPPFLHSDAGFMHGIQQAVDHWKGVYRKPGQVVTTRHLHDLEEIKRWLVANVDTPLAADIETFSLKHWTAGLGSIAFATSPYEAVAFAVDLGPNGPLLRDWLRQWFTRRNAWTLWHNATFDLHVLVYQLWMKGFRDYEGLRTGLGHMTRQAQCSKIQAYLATNSAQGNSLGLKELAQEFLGDWAVEDITDIRAIPLPDLLDYNGKDAAAAFWVHEQMYPRLQADAQEPVYTTLLQPAMTDVVEMQLVGLPFSMKRAKRVHGFLEAFRAKAAARILRSPAAVTTGHLLAQAWVEKRNAKLKKKRVTVDDWPESFNIGSDQQLAVMLYQVMGLPVIETTDSGQPATDGDTLKALVNHATDPDHQAVLKALLDWRDADKLLSAFFPHLLSAPMAEDGWHYLYGSFNIGGTVSGRLSSSGPNLQNQPSSKARFAKIYKYIFCAPPGWVFVGADFNALEDRIDALKTRDPNKLAVFTRGFDGHCFRAAYYFSSRMAGIDPTDPVSVNSIKKRYPTERQDSKAPYFALTYLGTWKTLVKNCGFPAEVAKEIEAGHHRMYSVARERTEAKIAEASRQGYLDVAFGLRVRAPLLQKYGTSLTLSQAEGRTVANAWGQSYGLLNTRAGTAFLKAVRAEQRPIYPCAQIHDAQYFLAPADPEQVLWINQTLTREMSWQDIDEIRHPEVGLGGELDVFRFSWAKGHTLPVTADIHDVAKVLFP